MHTFQICGLNSSTTIKYYPSFHTQMKSSSREALISYFLEMQGLGNAVIYAESVGEWGMSCSSNPDDVMSGVTHCGISHCRKMDLNCLLIIETNFDSKYSHK